MKKKFESVYALKLFFVFKLNFLFGSTSKRQKAAEKPRILL